MTNGYGELDKYGTYGEGDLTPYELLLRLKSFNKAIYLTIENNDEQIRTQLAITSGEIRQEVLDVKQGLETTLSTTAAGINANIANVKQGLETTLSATAAGLQANITNSAAGLQTQISANANGLASKVSQTDFNGQTVASLITQNATAIGLLANSLNLSGYVTFNSLTSSGTTNIDGARITTGLISADRIQAQTVLAKLIQAGGISADQITSGTINANRLSANAITTTLINAGGINANIITAGAISGDRIAGGTISGVRLVSDMTATVGGLLFDNSSASISWNYGSSITNFANGTMAINANRVTIPNLDISGYASTRTDGLGFGYSSSNKRLYVSIGGTDVGFVTLT